MRGGWQDVEDAQMSKSGYGTIVFRPEVWPIINRAVEKMRIETDQRDMTRERAIELLCADFVSGGLP